MLNQIKTTLDSLIIFQNIKSNTILSKLCLLCETDVNDNELIISRFSDFSSALYKKSINLSEYIKKLVLEDENLFTKSVINDKPKSEFLLPQLKFELDKLSEIPTIFKNDLSKTVRSYFKIFPICESLNLYLIYSDRIKNINKIGFGLFSKHNIFIYDNENHFQAVNSHNIRSLSEMYNYNGERQRVIENTKALLNDKPACNVLLYGDAGTGKSSTIKAIANEYKNEGLRLIELKKNQISKIPDIIEKISDNPLKFIIFIDDVTFLQDDPDFCALKTILDGDSKGLSKNAVVYITSNHRHLIKETAGERSGDIINTVDNIQGVLGLSARFGLTVTFLKPNKIVYNDIIINMARDKGIKAEKDALLIKAEAFAIRNGGRTPRTAKQFIDLVFAGVEKIN